MDFLIFGFLLMILLPSFSVVYSQEIPKIAVIGAGIGGSACAHFINNDLGGNVSIDIFEAHEVGGRVATVDYAGNTFETGGCVIHERNQYMNNFRKLFHLDKRTYEEEETLGIYNDNRFDFITSRYRYYTFIKMLFHYGYLSLHRLHSFVDDMLEKFDKIYEIQNEGRAFKTVEDLFKAANPDFLPYFEINSAEGFKKHANVNRRVLDELIQGSLRVNYGQDLNVHLFVGAVSVAGMFGSLWAVKGGNKRIPQLLVQDSQATFYKRKVDKIHYSLETKQYILDSLDEDNNIIKVSYDHVVIAAPLTADTVNIRFENMERPNIRGSYHRTVATIVAGEINGKMFHTKSSHCPSTIICTNETSLICSLSSIRGVYGTESKNPKKIWKIFSPKPLEDHEMNTLFKNYEEPKMFDWLAYPEYKKENNIINDRSFVLHDKLYYINAIEWAASAMEMSVIGAKNVALLIKNRILNIKNLDEKLNNNIRNEL